MKLSFPLYVKMLVWFFLNLVLLVFIGLLFFKAQFHLGLDTLFLGQARERIQSVANVINTELNQTSKTNWNAILQRFSDAYHVRFCLFGMDGNQLAGPPTLIPMEVQDRLQRPLRANGPMRRNRALVTTPDQITAYPPPTAPPPTSEYPQRGNGAHNRFRGPPQQRNQPAGEDHIPFLIQTPNGYWAAIPIDQSPAPAMLLASSDSFGTLFVDYRPWMAVGISSILISILFWLPLARGLTHSISQITRATEEIAAGRFDTQVAIKRRDELGRLASAINQMADRLKGFVTGQKRFLGDTAHELCSPIARMQLSIGILEQKTPQTNMPQVEDLKEEIQHMSSLVNELLAFSRASLQPATIKLQPVNLLKILDQAIQREIPPETKIITTINENVFVLATPDLLLRSISNILRNSVRYAGQASPIQIKSETSNAITTITITDCGPGIPPESIQKIFDPFYRPEISRDRKSGGVGLGLAIVKTCVESCKGTVTCKNLSPTGLEVSIHLPTASHT